MVASGANTCCTKLGCSLLLFFARAGFWEEADGCEEEVEAWPLEVLVSPEAL